jgi:hypothetical protein
MLAKEVRYITGQTLRAKTDYLKKDLIREALQASGTNIGDAAKALGESHQALSFMLKNKYPELYDEFGIKRKSRKAKSRAEERDESPEPSLQHVLMPENMKFAYDFHVEETFDISTYLLSADLTRRLGLKGSKLIALATIELTPGTLVLYKSEGEHYIDRVIYDSLMDLFVIERGEGDFVFLTDEVTVFGVPIGYCNIENINETLLKFRKINIPPETG